MPVETAEKKEITFPMEAFDGYFYDYLMAYRGNNEVCPAYHFAGLLSVVGATLGRDVFLEGVHPIFYQALIGKTTIARKSTALNLATRLITSEDQLSNNTRQYSTVAKYPTAGLIGCSTYAWLESGIPIDDIVGGFAIRFMFYLPEQQELAPKVSSAQANKLESVRERIAAIRKEWQGRHQKFILMMWHRTHTIRFILRLMIGLFGERNELVAAAQQRTLDYAKKLALVFAVLDAKKMVRQKSC